MTDHCEAAAGVMDEAASTIARLRGDLGIERERVSLYDERYTAMEGEIARLRGEVECGSGRAPASEGKR